jgi:polyisoprenyl-teichoic acid--peptidoglycan teichoic acid transferase
MIDEKPPRVGLGVIKRAAVAAVLIVLSTAGAVSATVILDVKQIQQEFTAGGRQLVDIPEVTNVDPGRARTIMILGSDERYRAAKDEKPRSDTIILLRVDPRRNFISVLSIPRDLQTVIPGFGLDKINGAFEQGGPRLTVRTVKQLLSTPGDPFHVNNVVIVDFGGFQRAVNYIGGVYVDVDRRYFNDHTGPGGYAAIDLKPGYQRLPGSDSLDYVRYRHTDDDFVRAARQQSFLRALKNQPRVRDLLDFNRRHELAKIFRRYIEVDRSLRSTRQVFSLLKLAIAGVLDIQEVRQVRFRGGEVNQQADIATGQQPISYVTATPDQIASTVREFMRGPRRSSSSSGASRRSSATGRASGRRERRKRARRFRASQVRGLQNARAAGETHAIAARRRLNFPFYFPTRITNAGGYAGTDPMRIYGLRDEGGRIHRAYRLVLSTGKDVPQYYGVQGTTWKDPPILKGADAIRTVMGRKLRIYKDGEKTRMVAWRTPKAVYWISNSLDEDLTRDQMLAVAASLKRLGQK